MIQKPEYLASEFAEPFQDRSVVEAYRYRPSYPVETFDILAWLVKGEPRRVLDVGCGTGYIARSLVERVDWLDAVDISRPMIEMGRSLPNGDHPHLRWLYGRAEDVALDPPYGLITAGASLHWMDWNVVLPRFRELLLPGAYLAIVRDEVQPNPWSTLREIIARYSINKKYRAYDMLAILEQHGLFQKVGEQTTAPVPFVQSIEDYIKSYHARSGCARERMGEEQAAAFDEEVRQKLQEIYPSGQIEFQVMAEVVWGIPGRS